MSFTRYMLASWRIAFVPEVGAKYRERNRGPFEGGSVMTPLELRSGYVRYQVETEDGHTYEMIATFGVFASMSKECQQ